MSNDLILSKVREALVQCKQPRFFETERGFQGQLLIELSSRIKLTNQMIIEQEYQKKLLQHGMTIRPDIIIHEPFDSKRHSSRACGNVAVIELKLKANASTAASDFESLRLMLDLLQYPLGIFINIGSSNTHSALISESERTRIVAFGVTLKDGNVSICESSRHESNREIK